jgi:heme exporter protein C
MAIKQHWWKVLGVALVLYSIILGFLGKVPAMWVLHETIRNLYFHVSMWFAMMTLLTISLGYSIAYLRGFKREYDVIATEAANVALMFGFIGIVTGMAWAKFTWGDPWPNDPKMNGVAVGMIAYIAYFILRASIDEQSKRGRIAAVYNIFAYVMFMVFVNALPRIAQDSMHPGQAGNPGFGALAPNMIYVFYPGVIGWILVGVWLLNVRKRMREVEYKQLQTDMN